MKKEIVFLGIDGSGKSTMSIMSKIYLEKKGFNVKIVPFHKWVFADFLRTVFGKVIDKDRKDRNSPYSPPPKSFSSIIKPPIAFIDNIIFYILNKPIKNNHIVIYDRFICATQIKFRALNYNVKWFEGLWWNLKPKNAIIFTLDVDESIERQIRRNDPYAYTKEQLTIEQELYIKLAKKYNFPIINTTNISPEETFQQLEVELNKIIKK